MSNLKLMIEVDERIIEHITAKDLPLGMVDDLCRAVENGTPITEGDLISRSALRKEISNAFIDGATKSIFKKYIDNAPSIGGSQNE